MKQTIINKQIKLILKLHLYPRFFINSRQRNTQPICQKNILKKLQLSNCLFNPFLLQFYRKPTSLIQKSKDLNIFEHLLKSGGSDQINTIQGVVSQIMRKLLIFKFNPCRLSTPFSPLSSGQYQTKIIGGIWISSTSYFVWSLDAIISPDHVLK